MKHGLSTLTMIKTSIFAVASVGAFMVSPLAGAATSTYIWTGDAGDNQLATAGNWAENSVPTEGAKLVFTCKYTTKQSLTNSLSVKIAEIETSNQGVTGDYCEGLYEIDTVNFQDDTVFSGQGNNGQPAVRIENMVGIKNLIYNNASVSGNRGSGKNLDVDSIIASGSQQCLADYVGSTINSSKSSTIGSGIGLHPKGMGAITVKSGGVLGVASGFEGVYDNNIVFETGAKIGRSTGCLGGGGVPGNATITLSGDIVLNGTIEVTLPSYLTLKVTGNLSGSGKLVPSAENEGIIKIDAKTNTSSTDNGTVDSTKAETINVDGNKPDDYLGVKRLQTAILSGTRGATYVGEGGILKGVGTVKSLDTLGIVAPGNSPGKITILDSLSFGGTGVYQAEISNINEYDQLIISGEGVYDQNYKPISIAEGAKLDLSFLAGGVVKKGETYILIDNKSNQPIDGTFATLPEGARIVIGDAVFTVSYVGGDGNDFILTVMSDAVAPGTPNTGLSMVHLKSPVAVLTAAVMSVIALGLVAKRKGLRK